jgi:beta-phosphoglucomutase
MRCIAVSFVGHHSEETLRQAGADRVVKTLAEVSAEEVAKLIE